MREEKSIEQIAIEFESQQRRMMEHKKKSNINGQRANKISFAIKKLFKEKKS